MYNVMYREEEIEISFVIEQNSNGMYIYKLYMYYNYASLCACVQGHMVVCLPVCVLLL